MTTTMDAEMGTIWGFPNCGNTVTEAYEKIGFAKEGTTRWKCS